MTGILSGPPQASRGGDAAIDLAVAQALLFEEAACLDEQRWDDWLALFAPDAVYWVPSWKDHAEVTTDPDRELSLIYYAERERLEERIWRIRSGQSPASMPVPRTLHMIGNVRLDPVLPTAVRTNAVVHVFSPRLREEAVHFSTYRIEFRQDGDAWRIANKTIKLLNDYLPSSIDIYSI